MGADRTLVDSPISSNGVSILIPTYGGAELLQTCLKSLALYASSDCHIFVLDDGTPNESVHDCVRSSSLTNVTYARSHENRGFVKTCNWGALEIAPVGSDILILNSDTEATEGFLAEMIRVLNISERHAVVVPRSNNATIFSIPLSAGNIEPQESYRIWEEIRSDLPDYRLMPTAVGFCMLIKAVILERFGLFDEIYSPGYNEENDFVCRINRCGFSVVAANKAFVFHYENSTFGSRREALDREHRKILINRYPEYEAKVTEYFDSSIDPIERFAILRQQHRPSILYDLFHLEAQHTGTSEFSLNLLREIYTLMSDECDIFVGLTEGGRFFSPELNGYRLYEDRRSSDVLFDLVFKPSQIFTWGEFRRANRLSPRLAFVLQDIIAVRCDYLASQDRKVIFTNTVELADQVYTISKFSHCDLNAFYNKKFSTQIIHHGTNVTATDALPGEYVLVIGNKYKHKAIQDALPWLTDVGPVLAIGGEFPVGDLPSHVRWLRSGNITRGRMRDIFARARVLVYPSYYEGFGLPIVDSLALGKRVIALDNEVNRELSSMLCNPNLSLIRTFADLRAVIEDPTFGSIPLPGKVRRWRDVAEDYVSGFRQIMARRPDVSKIRARTELIRLLDSAKHP